MDSSIAHERLRKRFAKWDVDGSGSLEKADLQKEATQIGQAFGQDGDSPQVRQLADAFTAMFDHLAGQAGVGGDGSLTEEQFVSATGSMIAEGAEDTFNNVLGPVMRGIVGLCDKNDDGQINRDEWKAWMQGVGVDESQAQNAFDQVDTNGNGELSVDELLGAVRDYHYGRLEVELLG